METSNVHEAVLQKLKSLRTIRRDPSGLRVFPALVNASTHETNQGGAAGD
jgi:hypothetical protein